MELLDTYRQDPEFLALKPALSYDQYAALETEILTSAVIYAPIIVWHGLILDGYQRVKIIRDHPYEHIQYNIVSLDDELADREAAIAWICNNHLSGRTLSKVQRTYFIGKRYNAEKASHGALRSASVQNGNLHQSKTVDRLAGDYGIGASTVLRYANFAEAVDLLESYEPGVREVVLAGKCKIKVKDAEAILEMPVTELLDLANRIVCGDPNPMDLNAVDCSNAYKVSNVVDAPYIDVQDTDSLKADADRFLRQWIFGLGNLEDVADAVKLIDDVQAALENARNKFIPQLRISA